MFDQDDNIEDIVSDQDDYAQENIARTPSGGNDSEMIEKLQAHLDEALVKAEENLAGWKRTQADLENYRKRKESESSGLINFGKQAAFVQILPVLDSLQQAMVHAPQIDDEKYKAWKIGLDGIVKQINSAISQMGVERIEAIGKRFDPELHEAVREVPGNEDGIVVEEYQTGYLLNGQMIRPAQVAISKVVS
jgi:molecular chaperone GrpE